MYTPTVSIILPLEDRIADGDMELGRWCPPPEAQRDMLQHVVSREESSSL